MSTATPTSWQSRLFCNLGVALAVLMVVVLTPALPAVADPTYFQIRNVWSGRCLDADLATMGATGTKVHLWSCYSGTNQQWYWDGERLRNRASGRCLDADTDTINGNGTKIQLWDCHAANNQKWYRNASIIRNRWSPRCLDADTSSINSNGTKMQLWDCNPGNNEKWKWYGTGMLHPSISNMGAVYFSPYGAGQKLPNSTTVVMAREQWYVDGSCYSYKMSNVPTFDPNAGDTVTSLAGWSLGRFAPIDYLRQYPSRRTTVDHIVLIDPGDYSELSVCDAGLGAKDVLYEWLRDNPNAQLTIYSGTLTASESHKGIQQVYFPRIRQDSGVRTRVMVCNYNLAHEQAYWTFDDYIAKPPFSLGSCPNGGYYWHP